MPGEGVGIIYTIPHISDYDIDSICLRRIVRELHQLKEKSMKAYGIAESKLKQINALLGQGIPQGVLDPGGYHSIDEIAVMKVPIGNTESYVVFEQVKDGRPLDMSELWGPIEQFMFSGEKVQTGAITTLEGQAGEMFDFMVLVIGADGDEYYVLGNFLAGELKNLRTNPNWELAKDQFIVMAMELVGALESGE